MNWLPSYPSVIERKPHVSDAGSRIVLPLISIKKIIKYNPKIIRTNRINEQKEVLPVLLKVVRLSQAIARWGEGRDFYSTVAYSFNGQVL
jgi:hypothetical protein